MSYTARPPFSGSMPNQNQQQQQGGQQNNSNTGPSGIPNMSAINNAASIPANHLPNPSGSSAMSVMDQKIFQQQLMLQRQLLMQGQQLQQTQQNQQAKFQQQPNALNRIMSEMLSDKNGSNATQTQQFQQFVQMQAISNILQLQQAAQQKTFQQQSVPLPTNTTITPVARQNVPPIPKAPVNYPRTNVQNKSAAPNTSSGPMQSRKSFPNAPKSAMPQTQSGMMTAPLGGTSKSTLPQMPAAMTNQSASTTPKGYAEILLAANSQQSMNITPSLTITKTNSPSSSYNSGALPNKPMSNVTPQKSFLPEAISFSLGNAPISVKAPQPPSVTVTPTNKSSISPTNKPIPVAPLKTNAPLNVPGLQKLSPTSPRTKQTPRKNMNPIRTTSPATQTSLQSAVPNIDTKVTSPSVSISPSLKAATSPFANASSIKPPNIAVVPPTPPKANASLAKAPTASKPVTPINNAVSTGNANSVQAKPAAVTSNVSRAIPATTSAPVPKSAPVAAIPVKTEIKDKKVENSAKSDSVKVENPTVTATTKTEKATSSGPTTPKPTETKDKQNASQTPSANNISLSAKDNKDTNNSKEKPLEAKTPVAKAKASQPSTPVQSVAEMKVKRNRLKTIPYQSPTPEIELVSKISAIEAINSNKKRIDEDRLTLFYKNEFLAVRNADGGFFLCQAMNNVYKSSPKIRIRWLSEEAAKKNFYELDFYDSTDIECVLTSVSLTKLGKGKFELSKTEAERIENILKKALDVEKGIVERPDVTEENPDGLDLSLYKDESQIEKKSSGKRKLEKVDSVKKATPTAKKRKSDDSSPDSVDRKSKSKAKSKKSANKTAVKSTPVSSKKSEAKDSDTESTTPKRVAKRKLDTEYNDVQSNETDSKTASKDGETDAKVSKVEDETPKQSNEKTLEAVDSAAQSNRTRRSKN